MKKLDKPKLETKIVKLERHLGTIHIGTVKQHLAMMMYCETDSNHGFYCNYDSQWALLDSNQGTAMVDRYEIEGDVPKKRMIKKHSKK